MIGDHYPAQMPASKAFCMSKETDIFITAAYSMLRSTSDMSLSRLAELYKKMSPVIHGKLHDNAIDVSVLVYSSLRLPACIFNIHKVLLSQSEGIFEERSINLKNWEEVTASARRRRYLYDGHSTLATFISSKSDLDDLIPTLSALQIEWNKIHTLAREQWIGELAREDFRHFIDDTLQLSPSDYDKLAKIWGEDFFSYINVMIARKCEFIIQNLEASYSRYRKETNRWWRSIESVIPDFDTRPVYFVSSNTHSLINVLSGYAFQFQDKIISYAKTIPDLNIHVSNWERANQNNDERESSNILYYLLKKYQQSGVDGEMERHSYEKKVGIHRIYDKRTLDIPSQIIDMRYLDVQNMDPGIDKSQITFLKNTRSLIINIDYPLGRTAYYVLSKIAEHANVISGVYIIGKAASLTADSGDILLPSSVFDLYTNNLIQFDNCIKVNRIKPFVKSGAFDIYDNQKAVTVLGTFIQSKRDLELMFNSELMDIEMESGPYLSAIYEMAKPKRYPEMENLTLNNISMDLGIVHYVSDNPFQDKKLGDGNLSFKGIAATYAATLAVVERIFALENKRFPNE